MNDKKKYVLMLKFLVPFSIFIVVIVTGLILYFIPRYKNEFSLDVKEVYIKMKL